MSHDLAQTRSHPLPDVNTSRKTLRSQFPVFLLGDHGDAQTGASGSGVEITQIERWRRSPGTRDEEWFLVQTGASLGDIRSLGAVAEFARSCAKSRRCRRGGGSSRRRDRRQLSQEIFTAPLVFDAWLVSLKGMELMYALPCE